ncbi:MAG: hypothetical protein IBX67_01930 [Dehalococcoidia bacterium]|nr:hypothetical protein [Dehalococcoidia bacterium]
MSLAGHLYRLQQLDLELHRQQQELGEIERQLSDTEALVAAEARLASLRARLEDARKSLRNSEWELDDLQEKVKQIGNRLYGGTTKNPKELVNLELELKAFKGQIKPKEDALLRLMGQAEEAEFEVSACTEELDRLKQEWEDRQATMGRKKDEIVTALARLSEDRDSLVMQVTPEALNVYERTRLARGQAVVKVERGKCRGCHITVPTSQWQKARSGDLIQCSSCNRILYLE